MGLAVSINQFLANEMWKGLERLERNPNELSWKQFHHTFKGNSGYCDLPWLNDFFAKIEHSNASTITKILETKKVLMSHDFFSEDKSFTWEEVIAWLKDWSSEASFRIGKDIFPLTVNVSPVVKKQVAPKEVLPYFIHLIHNSLEHGIECPAMRQAKNKPLKGRVWIEISLTDHHQKITFGDDGQGVCGERVKELGHTPCPSEKTDFVWSGKGLGLYDLTQQISSVGGVVTFSSTPFQGFMAIIEIPHSQKAVKIA
jgi:hypothetical protein